MAREFYSRNLPHWHPPGATFFLTARLHGSLPQAVIQQLRADYDAARAPHPDDDTPTTTAARALAAHRTFFAATEQHLEHGRYGPTWLADARVAALTLATLREQAAEAAADVLIACVMPNHAHLVLTLPPTPGRSLQGLLQRWKSLTARAANVVLGRTGRFWQAETYDHVVRGGWPGVGQAVRYTALNPCQAGLCNQWHHWPGTYVAPAWAEALAADLGGP